jgi:hypothetical protein
LTGDSIMRRGLSVLLVLGLVACGPGQPSNFESETSEDHGDGDGDGDGDALSVLFIGNSYTYTNDLPGVVASMAAADSNLVTIEALTMEGAHVATHLMYPELASLLEQDFDVVVIQGFSFEPILDYPGFEQAIIEVAAMAGDARVVLFQTWPRHPDNPELVELGMTVEEMWAGVEQGYFEAATAIDSDVAQVGAAWMSALELEPPIGLYSSDGDHPIVAGSFLSACVIYGTIFDEACSTNDYFPVGMPTDDVVRLRMVADITNDKLDP